MWYTNTNSFWEEGKRALESAPLIVIGQRKEGVPLHVVHEALQEAGFPATFGLQLAGDAPVEALLSPDWETAFLRWQKPELHEVILLQRWVLGSESEAEDTLKLVSKEAQKLPMSGGKLLIDTVLESAATLYTLDTLPALLADEDHPAWGAMDIVLRTLADWGEGIIYAEGEGFYDSDGEPMILDVDLTYDWGTDAEEEDDDEA